MATDVERHISHEITASNTSMVALLIPGDHSASSFETFKSKLMIAMHLAFFVMQIF